MRFTSEVVYLMPGFPEDEDDINCFPYIQDFMLELAKLESLRIRVVALQYPFKQKKYFWNGIEVVSIGGSNKRGVRKLITWGNALMTLYKFHRRKKIQIIHSFWLTETTFLATVFRSIIQVKLVATSLGQDSKSSNRYLQLLNFEKIYLTTLSDFLKKELQKTKPINRIKVIPSGIRKIKIKSNQTPESSFDIVGVGNLSTLKNFDLFIETIGILKVDFPQLKVAIIGDGKDEERKRLLNKCHKAELEQNIFFLGHLNRYHVLEIMSQSAVLLHTSLYEGQGFVITEALAMGMAVVSTPIGDTKSIVQIENGVTALELATHIKFILTGKKARQSYVLKSAESSAKDYVEVYCEVLS